MPPVSRAQSLVGFLDRSRFFFSYVAHHKWLVLRQKRRSGASWRALVLHDVDKLWPDYLWLWLVRAEIERADRLHRERARHMPGFWVDQTGPGTTPGTTGMGSETYRPMPEDARRELLADWLAAHRQGGGRDLAAFFVVRGAARLHPETRDWLASQLGVDTREGREAALQRGEAASGWALTRASAHEAFRRCASCSRRFWFWQRRYARFEADQRPNSSSGAYCTACGPPTPTLAATSNLPTL
jgi:hypothetical protein